MELFPSVPEDLEAVSTDELEGFRSEIRRIGAEIGDDIKRPEEDRVLLSAEMSASDITEALGAAASELLRITEAIDARAEAEANFVAAVDEGLAALGVETEASAELAAEDEPEPEPEPAPDDGDGDEEGAPAVVEAESVLAAAEEVVEEEKPARRMAIPSGPSRYEAPARAETNGATVVATDGLGLLKVREGTPLTRIDYAEKVVELAKRLGPVKHVKHGGEDKYSIGMTHFQFPEEFTLNERDAAGNLEKIRAVSHSVGLGAPSELEVFMAAGGICAPPTPFYDVPGFASRERPVRNALPSFNARRGGVSVPSVNTVDRGDDGVTVIEADADEAGGTFATKACRVVECATWTDTFIGIISHCLEVGNLNARTWPEGVALENDNLMAGWAATAETRLLNRIRALSVQNTADSPYNAVHGLIYAIARAQASISNVMRAAREASYTALIPEWFTRLLVSDFAAQSNNEERYRSAAAVENVLAGLNVNVAWYKDSPTAAGGVVDQDFAAEISGTTLDNFPLSAEIGVFLNGTFLHLDGGSLELGLVRDSSLNEMNDYLLWGESFENVARIGPEQAARWIRLATCPDGTFPALATALACA